MWLLNCGWSHQSMCVWLWWNQFSVVFAFSCILNTLKLKQWLADKWHEIKQTDSFAHSFHSIQWASKLSTIHLRSFITASIFLILLYAVWKPCCCHKISHSMKFSIFNLCKVNRFYSESIIWCIEMSCGLHLNPFRCDNLKESPQNRIILSLLSFVRSL